jgi:hypothetical protein
MEHPNELNGESFLWRCVLAQAVRDLYCGEPKHRLEALQWVASKDFETVCDFASIEVDDMREQLKDLAALPDILAKKYGKMLRDKIMEGVHR